MEGNKTLKIALIILLTAAVAAGATALVFTQMNAEPAAEIEEETLPLDKEQEAAAEPCIEEFSGPVGDDLDHTISFEGPCGWNVGFAPQGTFLAKNDEVRFVFPTIYVDYDEWNSFVPLKPREVQVGDQTFYTEIYYSAESEITVEHIEVPEYDDLTRFRDGYISLTYKTDEEREIFDNLLATINVEEPESEEEQDEEEESAEEEAAAQPASKEFAFDSCGNLGKYESTAWYGGFMTELEKEFNFPPDHLPPNEFPKRTELCLSLDGSMVIALVRESVYMRGDAEMFRYYTATNVLQEASYDTQLMVLDFDEFKKRVGDYVIVEGATGDAGIGEKWTFHYYFKDNYVKLAEHCVDDAGTPVEGYECQSF